MSFLTQWELYGKDLSGHPLPAETMEPLCDRLEELADEYYTAECLGAVDKSELICALMTDYSSAYEEVVDAVTACSKSLPDATFLLSYDNTDTDVHQHIHIRDGDREELDGHIVYETPKRIHYDAPLPKGGSL